MLHNFARLTNIISEECPTFALFKSDFRKYFVKVGKLVERHIFLKFQVLVYLIQTGAMDDQSFEFLLNNFARLTNIISEECPTFALSKSVFRLQVLFIVFML